jgi:hypothetical protein
MCKKDKNIHKLRCELMKNRERNKCSFIINTDFFGLADERAAL